MNWYYDLGGQRQGPVPEAELDRLLAAGTINGSTLVWCEGMANWAPLKDARPSASGAPSGAAAGVPEGWIRCAATGRYFPPSQIVWLDGKPYSAEAKAGIVQGVMQGGTLPSGSDEERTGPAWEQCAQLGFFPAIWQTIKAVLMDPNRAFETMKREGGLGTPLGFYMVMALVVGVLALIYNLLFGGAMNSFIPPQMRGQPNPFMPGGHPGVVFYVGISIGYPIMMLLASFIVSGVLHLSLMICSGAKQPFETTYRTHAYAMGAGTALAIIPICGGSIGFLWGLVCLCMGLAKTHEIGTGRAVGAVLLPVGVCCVLYVVLIGAVIGLAASAGGLKH